MKRFVEMEDHLKAVFEFGSFIEAVDFVNQIADLADSADHHPDILIHDVKNVTVTLQTHDADQKVTKKDRDLAEEIESVYKILN